MINRPAHRVIAAVLPFLLVNCGGPAPASSPAAPTSANRQSEYEACVARERFGDAAASLYVLPFTVGATYVALQ